MTTTVLELITNLKHYPGSTKLTIKNVDGDFEFAIVDFKSGDDGVSIIINEKEYEEEE